MTDTTPDSTSEQRVPRWWLWFGLIAPTCAWAVHGLASYYLTMEVCHLPGADAGAARVALILLTVAALAFAVAGALFAWRGWRRVNQKRLTEGEGRGLEELLALTGIFVSASFTVGILWGGLPSVLLFQNLCEAWR